MHQQTLNKKGLLLRVQINVVSYLRFETYSQSDNQASNKMGAKLHLALSSSYPFF